MKNNFLVQAMFQIIFISISLILFLITLKYYHWPNKWPVLIAIITWQLLNVIFSRKIINPEIKVSTSNVISLILILLILITVISFFFFGITQHTTSFNLIISNAWSNFLLPLMIILIVVGIPLLSYMGIKTIFTKKK